MKVVDVSSVSLGVFLCDINWFHKLYISQFIGKSPIFFIEIADFCLIFNQFQLLGWELMFYHANGDGSGYKVEESGRPIDDIYHQLFFNNSTSLASIETDRSLFVLGYSGFDWECGAFRVVRAA
jgi:hypothetical protein